MECEIEKRKLNYNTYKISLDTGYYETVYKIKINRKNINVAYSYTLYRDWRDNIELSYNINRETLEKSGFDIQKPLSLRSLRAIANNTKNIDTAEDLWFLMEVYCEPYTKIC